MVPEGWQTYRVGDIARIQVGRDLIENRFSETETDTHRFPVYSNTVENFGLYGYYDFEEYSGNSLTVVGRGIGLGTAFVRDHGYGAIGRLLIVSPRDEKFDPRFLTDYINFCLIIHSESGGIPQLPGTSFANYHVTIPPLPEQKKIADILSTWDKALKTTEKLLANAEAQKRALMQQLLTGKRRLPGFEGREWQTIKLSDVFQRITRRNGGGCKNVLTISGRAGLVSQREYFNKSVAAADLSGYYLIRGGEFAYNKSYSNGYPLGAIKILPVGAEGVLSTLYICFSISDRDANHCDFFRHWFEAGRFNKEIYKIAQEGARNHGLLNVSVTDFFKAEIHVPEKEEQLAIATILNTAEAEETARLESVRRLRTEKRALMQQLLTGKRRVKL